MRTNIFNFIFKAVLAGIFLTAGFVHLFKPEFYLLAMPPYIPFPKEVILVSGVIAILLGLALIVKPLASKAAWGMIFFLIAVTPVHIYMLLNPKLFPDFSTGLLRARLLGQIVLIVWAYFYIDEKESSKTHR